MNLSTQDILTQVIYEEKFSDLFNNVNALTKVWCEDVKNITGFEGVPSVQEAFRQLEQAELNNASKDEIMSKIYNLKDAKAQEYAKRVDFDTTLENAQGFINIANCIALVTGNPKLTKIVHGSQALLSIGTQVGALLGFGTLAASVDPVMAISQIGLTVCNIFSLFGNEENNGTTFILESLEHLKQMIEYLREEMHERFNIIEEILLRIHNDLVLRISQLTLQHEKTQLMLKEISQANQANHNLTHEHLGKIQTKINGLFSIIREQQVTQALQDIIKPVQCCLNHITIHPTPEQYEAWLAEFQILFQHSSCSAVLTGYQSCDTASQWNLQYKSSSEAAFHINELLGYLNQRINNLNLHTQPNMILWAYPSLAILRLVFLLNSKDSGMIRSNEYKILELIRQKGDSLRKFYIDLKNPEIALFLIQEYKTALLQSQTAIQEALNQLNTNKNNSLNQHTALALKMQWDSENINLTTQNIPYTLCYNNWFKYWTNTHYGGIEYNLTNLVTVPQNAYINNRNQQIEILKRRYTMPDYIPFPGIQITPTSSGISIHIDVKSHHNLAILPEDPNDPVLNIWNQSCIDFPTLLDIPQCCFEAEYLDLGVLSYKYSLDQVNKKIKIKACMNLNQKTYIIRSLECFFDIGVYNRKEGIVWGWFGNTSLNLQTVGPHHWIGGTGRAKHWFNDFAIIPILTSPDVGPLASLVNPHINNRRHITINFETDFLDNINIVENEVKLKLQSIMDEYNDTFIAQTSNPNNLVAQSLSNVQAAQQRLQAFIMLSLSDINDASNNTLFENQLKYINTNTSKTQVIGSKNYKSENSIFQLPLQIAEIINSLDTELTFPLQKLLNENNASTCNNLFDLVYEQVNSVCIFYEKRIKNESYRDIFEESSETMKKFEDVTTLLQMIGNAISEEVKDSRLKNRIIANIQNQMAVNNLILPTGKVEALCINFTS